MKKIYCITLALLFSIQSATVNAAFSDVLPKHPYASDIKYVEDSGIEVGNEYNPGEPVSREVYARWILRNAGFKNETYEPKTSRRFFDVTRKKNPYSPYIYRLAELGIPVTSKKRPHLFRPKRSISKHEALEWLFGVEGIPVPKIINETNFGATDISADSTYAPLIHKAITLGILNPGRTKLFSKLTRAEAAHFLKSAHAGVPTITVSIGPSMDSDLTRNPTFDVLVDVWNRVFSTYLRRSDINKEELIYGAIEGLVKELGDKHSDFERPGDNAVLDSLSNEVEGIGAVVELNEQGELVIVSPISSSPAEKAGLVASDVITHVDDKALKGLKLSESVALIKGKKGTVVKLTIKRDGQILTFSVTRDRVKVVSAKLERTEDNFAKITLSNFGEHSTAEFKAVVDEITARPPRGIVLDLRNNPGGFLQTAVQITGFFVRSGEKVAIVRYPDRQDPQLSSGDAELANAKMVVIVNKGSASASEILAGALKDYGLAKIVGEKSFGKGTVQELSDFSDGSTLKITIAEWLTPKGNSIEGNGVVPDIEVSRTDADRKAGRDPQMERALEELRK